MSKERRKITEDAIDWEVVEEFLDWLAEGRMQTDFCRRPGYPAAQTLDDWVEVSKDLSDRVAQARAQGRRVLHEEILRIADEPLEGVEVTEELEIARDADGEPLRDDSDEVVLRVVNRKVKRHDNLGRSKLKIEARQKYLATTDPANYGERRQVSVEGKLSLEDLVLGVAAEMEAEAAPEGSEDLFG